LSRTNLRRQVDFPSPIGFKTFQAIHADRWAVARGGSRALDGHRPHVALLADDLAGGALDEPAVGHDGVALGASDGGGLVRRGGGAAEAPEALADGTRGGVEADGVDGAGGAGIGGHGGHVFLSAASIASTPVIYVRPSILSRTNLRRQVDFPSPIGDNSGKGPENPLVDPGMCNPEADFLLGDHHEAHRNPAMDYDHSRQLE